MPTTITIYTKPSCQPCKALKRWLDSRGITYTAKDISENPADMAAIRALGYQTVPVTIVNYGDNETELHWGGFDPNNLTKYVQKRAA